MKYHPDRSQYVERHSEGVAVIRNTLSQNVKTWLYGRSPVSSLDWSADGRFLATGHEDGTISIWDVESGKERFCLTGSTGTVNEVRWSRDARRIASTSSDGTLSVWDIDAMDHQWPDIDTQIDDEQLVSANDGELPSQILDEFPAYVVDTFQEPNIAIVTVLTFVVVSAMFLLVALAAQP